MIPDTANDYLWLGISSKHDIFIQCLTDSGLTLDKHWIGVSCFPGTEPARRDFVLTWDQSCRTSDMLTSPAFIPRLARIWLSPSVIRISPSRKHLPPGRDRLTSYNTCTGLEWISESENLFTFRVHITTEFYRNKPYPSRLFFHPLHGMVTGGDVFRLIVFMKY